MWHATFAWFVLGVWLFTSPLLAVVSHGEEPPVRARQENGRVVLGNGVLEVEFDVSGPWPRLVALRDLTTQEAFPCQGLCPGRIDIWENDRWQGREIRPAGLYRIEPIEGDPAALRQDDRFSGYRLTQEYQLAETGQRWSWWAELRAGAHFLVCGVRWVPDQLPEGRCRVVFYDEPQGSARRLGEVDGSPIVVDGWFLGCEHPMAENIAGDGQLRCAIPIWKTPGRATVRYTFAVGRVITGQLRRDFLTYVERRRARPYRLFVNYNSWWDIADGGKLMTESECLAVIERFGEELVRQRKTGIDSLVFDDGWDDPRTFWGFHGGFPAGFARLAKKAAAYGTAIGTWLSPFGGYGQAKQERLKYGREHGFEVAEYGFSLAGPRYFDRFRSVCRQMIEDFRVNYFKFDGIAGNNASGAGERFAPDVEALLRLCEDLRRVNPEIYLSITTGTWPSPYWLWFGDSVWRNGQDCGVAGWGPPRRQWITYRDGIVKRMIVDRAPLYPLNALMTIPVCFARRGLVARLKVDAISSPDLDDLRDEMWMGFASGTQLAELYVSPDLMAPQAWDQLAECIRWARAHQETLRNVHWVGGDPLEGGVYGYAAWSPAGGTLVLRNPADRPQGFAFCLRDIWDLPDREAGPFRLVCRYSRGFDPVEPTLRGDDRYQIVLPPLGMILWEAAASTP